MPTIFERGDAPLTYNTLSALLQNQEIIFKSLSLANFILDEELKKGLSDLEHERRYGYYNGRTLDNSTPVFYHSLQDDIIKKRLEQLKNNFGKLHSPPIVKNDDLLITLRWQNDHFLRTRFLNGLFEIFKKYLDKHEKLSKTNSGDSTSPRYKLHKEDWYTIFYILRNNASHADNLHLKNDLKGFVGKNLQPKYTWRTITVIVDDMAHDTRYNSEECLGIYSELLNFILNNKDLLTKDKSGNDIPQLLL